MVVIRINTDNNAFAECACADLEIAAILTQLANKLRSGDCKDEQPLFDANGNKVGTYKLTK